MNSVACSQSLSVWEWTTSTWQPIGTTQSVGTPDVLIADVAAPGNVGTGANAGQVRVRVACTGPTAAFVSSGNLMKIVYDAP
jgi:hypothetical protein